ncbi:glycine betaine ABC transporter substrate-binding protein [Arhodomonas sp. SL1]|uniref:glycine betaine ABC transporter substrate-binding protein n=1 Tax=Arhodomonas sp. SL1 TaxID=3425691 RepID=UPI003F882D02
MLGKTSKFLATTVLGLGLATGAQAQSDDPVRIGWTAWSDAEFVTKLAANVIENRLGRDVELVQTDIAPQYQGVAEGDIDVMLMSWQPGTHSDYLDQVNSDGVKAVNLGLLYGYARLGWAVPDYIPEEEVSSIEDLKKDSVRENLDGTITGIDPGAGLMRLSNETIEEYGLDYDLQSSSGAGMTAALDRAINRDEWIVVTAWSPHWMFGAYDLRYLEDPEGTLGSYERIHAFANVGFYQENPEVAMTLSRMQLPLADLEAAMFNAQEGSYEDAVAQYIEDNPARVEYWVTGELD